MRLPERKFGSETNFLASQEERSLSSYFSSSMPELNLDAIDIRQRYLDYCNYGQSSHQFFSSVDSIEGACLNDRNTSLSDFGEQKAREKDEEESHKKNIVDLQFAWSQNCNKYANKFNLHFNKMLKFVMSESPSLDCINYEWKSNLQSRPSCNPNFQDRKFPKSEPKIIYRTPSLTNLRLSTSDGTPQKTKDPQRKPKSVTWNESIEVYSKDHKIIQPLVEHEYLSQNAGDEYRRQREIWLRERSYEQQQNAYNRKIFNSESESSLSDDEIYYTSNSDLSFTSNI